MKQIKLSGRNYPFRLTMGAMIAFKNETGKEISEISTSGLSDIITFLWCCIASASRADHIEFNMSPQEMADALEPADFLAWQKEAFAETDNSPDTGDGTKKNRPSSNCKP
jgi:hypothetical protein